MGLKNLIGTIIPVASIGEERKFYCRHCKKDTQQIQVSMNEYYQDERNFAKVLCRINDWNPLLAITNGSCYRCQCCKNVSVQKGLFSDIINEDDDSRL